MKTSFESQRLFFRELLPADDIDMFEMDSDPAVCKFLGVPPSKTLSETKVPFKIFTSNTLIMALVAGL